MVTLVELEDKQIKTDEEVLQINNGLKNKWGWAWIEEVGTDGKSYDSWCKYLRQWFSDEREMMS